jgi:hypothetical protein
MNAVTSALRQIDPNVWLRAGLNGLQEEYPVVFDSMRFVEDYHFFRARSYVLVDIRAPVDVRVSRLKGRGQAFDPLIDEEHPAESELESYTFDYTINNTSNLDHLLNMVDELLSQTWEDLDAR